VSTDKLATDSVTAAKMANNNVNTSNLVNLSVTTAKLGNQSVTAEKLSSDIVIPTISQYSGSSTTQVPSLNLFASLEGKVNNLEQQIGKKELGFYTFDMTSLPDLAAGQRLNCAWSVAIPELVRPFITSEILILSTRCSSDPYQLGNYVYTSVINRTKSGYTNESQQINFADPVRVSTNADIVSGTSPYLYSGNVNIYPITNSTVCRFYVAIRFINASTGFPITGTPALSTSITTGAPNQLPNSVVLHRAYKYIIEPSLVDMVIPTTYSLDISDASSGPVNIWVIEVSGNVRSSVQFSFSYNTSSKILVINFATTPSIVKSYEVYVS
jgi:hypothetical protein